MTGRIGVAICTYRRPEGLARLLGALPRACAGLDPVVIVVDNDGTDPAVACVAAMAGGVRLVVETTPGISAARNRAFAEAEAAGVRLLALIDDDEWPAENWLAGLLAAQAVTGAAVVGGLVGPVFPEGARGLLRHARFWSVLPQARGGRPFVHATSNVLIDLAQIADVARPLFADAHGLSGGGDLVFFSRLHGLGKPMAWAPGAAVFEEVPEPRASLGWMWKRRFRVGNHMVMDEELRQGRWRPVLKTVGLAARLPVYPLLRREPETPWVGWWLEAAKLRGRIAAHRGRRVFEYARDGVALRRVPPAAAAEAPGRNLAEPPAPERFVPESVLVGIPVLNEARHIEACLRGLIEGDPAMARVRVVVADGGSEDGTRAIVGRLQAEFPNVELIDNPDRLQAAAVNRIAAGALDGETVLVRCDAHARYPEGYVRAAVAALQAAGPEVAAVASVLDAGGAGGFQRAAARIVDTPFGSGGAAHRGGRRSGYVDHGHHAAFRLDWFRRVGGYDESFSHNEDAELDHRLGLAGGRIWLDAGLRVGYEMRATLLALGRQYARYGRGRAQNLLKHRSRPRLRQLMPVAIYAALAAVSPVAALDARFLLPALGYGALLAGASLWCAVALRSWAGLWAGPALGVMHNAWAVGFLGRMLAPRG